jgi:hypothetical protein
MLLIVVAIFAICWFPFQAYNILQEIYPSINEYKYINLIWFACHLLAMFNSCVNPFIYVIFAGKFNREFRTRFPLCCFWASGLTTVETRTATPTPFALGIEHDIGLQITASHERHPTPSGNADHEVIPL